MAHVVQPEQVDEVATEILAVTKTLLAGIEEADVVARRMQSVWAGEAADAHLDRHEEWRADADLLLDALRELHKVLSGASANYSGAAAANTTMWG